MTLKNIPQLSIQLLDFQFVRSLQLLLAFRDTASAAPIEFLETQLGFGQRRLIFVVQSPQGFVHLRNSAEAGTCDNPLNDCDQHNSQHQSCRAGGRKGGAPPPWQRPNVMLVLLVGSAQFLHAGAQIGYGLLVFLSAFLEAALLGGKAVEFRRELAFARQKGVRYPESIPDHQAAIVMEMIHPQQVGDWNSEQCGDTTRRVSRTHRVRKYRARRRDWTQNCCLALVAVISGPFV